MSKTLTTYEALKANETKRVRSFGCDGWLAAGEMIDWLNRGKLYLGFQKWEAEAQPLIEQWVVVSDDGKVVASADMKEEAQAEAKGRRIVHLREVRS